MTPSERWVMLPDGKDGGLLSITKQIFAGRVRGSVLILSSREKESSAMGV